MNAGKNIALWGNGAGRDRHDKHESSDGTNALNARRQGLLAFVRSHQLADWHGYDVGRAPRCRNALFAEWRAENLGDDGADDGCDPAFAIEHRCSRSAVIDDEAVISFVYFEKTGARESAIGSVLHEPASYSAPFAIGVGHRHDAVVRHERRHPDRDAVRGGDGGLQFKHCQFFRPGAYHALNANRNRMRLGGILDCENPPILAGKPHGGGDMFDGYDNGGRPEPAGALDTEQGGLRSALRVVEISRNGNSRMRQQRGINAGCFGAGLNRS